MEFSVGDKVVYRGRGCGQIVGLENLDLVAGFAHYYVIKFPDQGLTIQVPVRKVDELGVRPAMSRARLARVLSTLRDEPCRLSEDFRERETWIRERLESGSPFSIAETVRDLTWYKRHARFTGGDSVSLTRGIELLSAEIALANGTSIVDAKGTIDAALAQSFWLEPGIQFKNQQ